MLIHIFVLGIPMLAASAFLLVVTVKIRRFLEHYGIQRTFLGEFSLQDVYSSQSQSGP